MNLEGVKETLFTFIFNIFSYVSINNESKLQCQSGVEEKPMSGVDKETILTFYDAAGQSASIPTQIDPTFAVAKDPATSLDNYLKRPVLIQSFEWSSSGLTDHSNSSDSPTNYRVVDPWTDVIQQSPIIKQKVNHFKMLRGTLRVKFTINGNMFQYGRMLASYLPLGGIDIFQPDGVDVVSPSYQLVLDTSETNLTMESQRMHVYLDPTYSQPGELTLPFFLEDNAMDIPATTFDNMGRITLRIMSPLQTTGSATTPKCTINVYAWFEEFTLEGTTSSPLGTGPSTVQAGEEGDEYGQGIISRPASIVGRAATLLSDVPIIGPYAMATSVVSNAIAGVASYFGFCKPSLVDPTRPVRPNAFGNMTNYNVDDTGTKLALDAKQEVTIDPRTTGLSGQDEMAILPICQKETYIGTSAWGTGDSINKHIGGVIANAQQYTVFQGKTSAGQTNPYPAIMPTAMGMVANAFRMWRGTIRVRVQVVASAFHKGRLHVFYDPDGYSILSTDLVTHAYETMYGTILDLEKTREIVFDIPWMQPHNMLKTHDIFKDFLPIVPIGTDIHNRQGGTFAPGTPSTVFSEIGTDREYDNGALGVRVLTPLTSPSGTGEVRVNFFVSAGDDMIFANPDLDMISRCTAIVAHADGNPTLETQAGEEEQVVKSESKDDPTDKATSSSQVPHALTIHAGEVVTTIRQLIKRYTLYRHQGVANLLSNNCYGMSLVDHAFPRMAGFNVQGMNYTKTSGDPQKYDYVHMTPLKYFSMMFAGYRGGVRYKVMSQNAAGNLAWTAIAKRKPFQSVGASYKHSSYSYVPTYSELNVGEAFPHIGAGGAITHGNTNMGLEVEIPYYSPARFIPSRRFKDRDPGFLDGNDTWAYARISDTDGTLQGIETYHLAAADDMSFFYFVGSVPLAPTSPEFGYANTVKIPTATCENGDQARTSDNNYIVNFNYY